MSTNQTANYGLHLWEPEDQFVREEFNENSKKVDAALSAASNGSTAALSGLEGVAYHVYNLMLQDYYDSKYTGYKKAVLFDGFRDTSGVASLDPGLVHSGGKLTLSRSASAAEECENGSRGEMAYGLEVADSISAPAAMALRRLTLSTQNSGVGPGNRSVLIELYINNALRLSETHTLSFQTSERTTTLTLRSRVNVLAGDEIYVVIGGFSMGDAVPCVSHDSRKIYAVYGLDPIASGDSAGLVSKAAELPGCARLLGWVRHKGGTVELGLRRSGADTALVPTGTRATVSLQNEACSETAFALDAGLDAGSVAAVVRLNLKAGENQASLLDYGVTML